MAVAQTSLWLPGPGRSPDGGAQASLGILEAFPPSLPGFLPFPHCSEAVRVQESQQPVKKGQPGAGELAKEAGPVFRNRSREDGLSKGAPRGFCLPPGGQSGAESWSF